MKIFMIVLFFASATCIAASVAGAAELSTPTSADVVLPQASTAPVTSLLDLGTTNSGQVVTKTFVLTNHTGRGIELVAKASCACTAVEPEQPALRNGESTRVNVRVNTAGRNGAGGSLELSYLIFDRLQAKETVLVNGKIDLELTPSVTFSEDNLSWRVGPGQDVLPHQIVISNQMDQPVDVVWSNDPSEAQFFTFEPSKVSIPAHSTAPMAAKPTPSAGGVEYMDNVIERFIITPADGQNSKLSKWGAMVTLSIVPDVGLIAEPGAIVLGKGSFQAGKAICEVHVARIMGSKATIGDATSHSDAVKIVKKADNLFEVQVNDTKDGMIDEVRIQYSVNGQKSELVVPVCVIH